MPLAPTFDHPGPMTRALRDCEPLLAALAGVERPRNRRVLRRYAVSPRIADLDPDVADGFERALAALPAERVEPPRPAARLDVLSDFFDLMLTEMLVFHRRFSDRRSEYRPAIRARLEHAERRAMTTEDHVAGQIGRTRSWELPARLRRGHGHTARRD